MTGILDKFHVEHGIHGARILTRSLQLSGYCTDDGEVNEVIASLKGDLDACGREMKRLLKLDHGSVFEGWPSPADDLLDA